MKNWMQNWISRLVLLCLMISGSALAESQLGRDYTALAAPQPSSQQKIEVLEFFFYECGHCFHLHPYLASWEKTMAKDVEIRYVPTMFSDRTEPLARTFYALESMGQIKQVDDAIYRAIHEKDIGLFDQSSISAFLAKNGVDAAKFATAYNSFGVGNKVAQAKQMIRTYNIQGTPTLIVAGKYVITGQQPQDVPRILNDVIAKVRAERAPTKPTAAKKH